MTPLAVSQFLYPRIYPITTLGDTFVDQNASEDQNPNGQLKASNLEVPSPIRASYEYFLTEEAYLIENGLVAFLWCGAGVPKEWLESVFNVKSTAHLDTEKVHISFIFII